MYEVRYGFKEEWIDRIMEIHNSTELKREDGQTVSRAFRNSFCVSSCWANNNMIGIGRMISDGEMYSAIFDVVVDPSFQKRGIGKKILTSLIAKAPNTCIHLSSTFGNEPFYHKLGFKRHKTAMALYPRIMANSPYLEQ